MENSFCLDSDFLVDFLRGVPEAVSFVELNKEENDFATTIINVFELYAGAYNSYNATEKIKSILSLISELKILDFSLASAEEAGKQYARLTKSGEQIDNRDLFIGSIALTEGFVLKTNNKKHFLRIAGLKVT